MERKEFAQSFSHRLIDLMHTQGHQTNRAKAGVDINKLAKITGCSYQMARKYTLGLALPELHVIVKISTWLKTTPSWLLFGNNEIQSPNNQSKSIIEIETDLLKYILNKSSILFALTSNTSDIVNFIVDAIYDAAHLNSETQTIHKIIDMMITSATLLKRDKEVEMSCAN